MNEITKLQNELLEILHVIDFDGSYSDKEALIETLRDYGVSEERIKYHLKK